MALWTPYADDIALDLSKPTKEKAKPITEETTVNPYPNLEETRMSCFVEYPANQFGYNYIPVPQMSPISVGSVSSYERPLTPSGIPTLSPPISPASLKRPFSMIDDSLSDDPDFQAFERDALRAMAEKNGGTLLGNNPRMRRSVRSNNDINDDSYRRQRERNNFAAKQSRDRRKLREIHLALKVSYLKKEVAGLKSLLAKRPCVRYQQSCKC